MITVGSVICCFVSINWTSIFIKIKIKLLCFFLLLHGLNSNLWRSYQEEWNILCFDSRDRYLFLNFHLKYLNIPCKCVISL